MIKQDVLPSSAPRSSPLRAAAIENNLLSLAELFYESCKIYVECLRVELKASAYVTALCTD